MTSPGYYPWEDTYIDDGSDRPQDDVEPEAFAKMRDRAPLTGAGSPFFSRREVEINQFRESAGQLAKGFRANNTLVFEGPPGCGKTALLDQITADVNAYPADRCGRDWLPVCMNGSRAMDPAAVMASVDEAIALRLAKYAAAEEPNNNALTRLQEFLGISDTSVERGKQTVAAVLGRGIRIGGFQVGAKNERVPRDIEDAIAMRGPKWDGWNIVLLIDEAQQIHNLGPEKTSTLSSIHQGMLEPPILFAAFGLVGTQTALTKVGVPRPSADKKFALGKVADDDVTKACERAMRRFKPTHSAQLTQAITKRSCGWPQHVASYLIAVAENPKQGVQAVLSKGDLRRDSYYGDRLESLIAEAPEFGEFAELTANLLRGDNRPMTEYELKQAVVDKFGTDDTKANQFLWAAKHAGIIRPTRDRRAVEAAIPSFLTYLTGEANVL